MAWTTSENRKSRVGKSSAGISRALKLCMPPNAPKGITFDQVLEYEYECLRRSADLARRICADFAKPRWHVAPQDPVCWYRRKPMDVRPQVHIGQLKLFLSELQFLTEFGDGVSHVVYAGAADGTHIGYLAALFPDVVFFLYDPRAFNPKLKEYSNIFCYTGDAGWFDTTKAGLYSTRYHTTKVLLISDIRTGDSKDPSCDFDACCVRDMKMQQEWMEAMRPAAAMFKFRLSYLPGKTTWLAPMSPEHLKYGIFATVSATEMRLICDDPNLVCEYDNTEMEERAYYFNNFTRGCQYGPKLKYLKQNAMKAQLGVDDCWDCCAMRDVCMAFLAKKWRGDLGADSRDALETVETISAAAMEIAGIPADLANIIAHYVSVVDEADLYGFISAILKNCGPGAQLKMHLAPHGARAPGVQWIDCMNDYRDAPLYSKKENAPMNKDVVAGIRELYANLGSKAPPLGKYMGPMRLKPREESRDA